MEKVERHIPVMLNETINNLNIKPDGIYVDCTMGGAGHSSEILKRLTTGHLYCFDQDEMVIKAAEEKLSKISNNFTIIHDNFVNIRFTICCKNTNEMVLFYD